MRSIFFFAIASIIISCSNSSAVSKQLSGSDSLIINFTAVQSDSVIKSVITTDEKAINRISRFADGKPSEEFKCGYNGSLLFFSKGKLLSDVNFNYVKDGCSHFLISVDGKLMSTKMSREAVDFLKSLAEGKEWY